MPTCSVQSHKHPPAAFLPSQLLTQISPPSQLQVMISGRNLYIQNGTYQQHNIYGLAAGQGVPVGLFCNLD